ncbi:restriction endonuclease subunit S [Echinicola rosea]|uniref:restriction endonuclease subunit S n=1 Tax=Echinicola rosea TaxID=1807691 RepID=UPI0016637962|nr:restriction endonuclease subunit S [Echinicola rosea]
MRFPGFSGEWKLKRIGDLSSKIGSGKTPKGGESVYHTSGIPFIRSQNVIDNSLILDHTCIPEEMHESMKSSKVLAGDILLNITGGSIGRSCVVPTNFKEGNVNQHVSIIRLKKDNPNFLQSILSSWRGQKLIFEGQTGSGREGLNFESIKGFKVSFPTVSEQQKIASFLSLLSERIKTQIKIIEQLETLMSGLRQKIFSRQLRFKDDEGNDFPKWEEKNLIQLASRIISKNKENNQNVLTISAQQGLISQLKFFNKSVAVSIPQ